MVHSTCRADSPVRRAGLALSGLAVLFLFAGCPCSVAALDPGSEAGSAPQAAAAGLGQAALQKAFAILKEHHVHAGRIDAETINRAALEGLLGQLHASLELVAQGELSAGEPATLQGIPTLLDRLDGGIAYLRLSLVDRVPEADELVKLVDAADWLLIDLRCGDGCDDFSRAAEFLRQFAPAGHELFRLRGKDPSQDKVFRSGRSPGALQEYAPVVVLVDAATSPAGEVIAGWFSLRHGSLVAGEPTAGATSRSASVPIAEGVCLRFAEAEVVFPGGETLLGRGVDPVLSMRSSDTGEAGLSRSLPDGVQASIVQRQRPRLNEAALVTGIDPQLAAHLEGGRQPEDEVVQDVALRQLVDLLRAIDLLGLGRPGVAAE